MVLQGKELIFLSIREGFPEEVIFELTFTDDICFCPDRKQRERGRWAKGVWIVEGRGMRGEKPRERKGSDCLYYGPLLQKILKISKSLHIQTYSARNQPGKVDTGLKDSGVFSDLWTREVLIWKNRTSGFLAVLQCLSGYQASCSMSGIECLDGHEVCPVFFGLHVNV